MGILDDKFLDAEFTHNIYIPNILPCTFNKIHKSMLLPVNVSKIAGGVANGVDPDRMLHSLASDLGLYCLLRPVCPNT